MIAWGTSDKKWGTLNTLPLCKSTPEQMSQAGLYYLGERDRVKCWYNNGGQQNWARFDNPWFKHAKWFPTCEYLLQKKGPKFVVNVFNRFPNLDRPVAINPAGPFVANIPQTASGPGFCRLRTNSHQFLIQENSEENWKRE